MITHWRLACEKCRSFLMDGRATFTMAMSSTTMNCAATMTARASQRLRSDPAVGSGTASDEVIGASYR